MQLEEYFKSRKQSKVPESQVQQIKAEFAPQTVVEAEPIDVDYDSVQTQMTPEATTTPAAIAEAPKAMNLPRMEESMTTRQTVKPTMRQPSSGITDTDLLVGLAPLVTSLFAGGQLGEGVDVAGKYYTGLATDDKKRRQTLEDKLMQLELKRKGLSGSKLPTASNLVPVVGEDGVTRYKWVSDAAGEKVATKPKTGFSLEDQMSLLKYKAALAKDMNKFKEQGKKIKEMSDKEISLSSERSKDPFTRDTRKVVSAYNNLVNIDPNSKDPIRDIGVVFEFMKTLDPGSVVRESEQSLVMGAKSIGDFVSNLQDMMTKNRKLTPEQVENIKKFAAINYSKRIESQKNVVDARYLRLAEKYGLDPSVIVDTLSVGTPLIWTDRVTGKAKIINVPDDQLEEALRLGAQRVK